MKNFWISLARFALSEAARCRSEDRRAYALGYLATAAHYRRKAAAP